ncbi:NUDIX hydrolase [bacterium]|nr:NUDIX hydrolase [bacterium]
MTADSNRSPSPVFQAGAIPFRRNTNGEIEVLLVTNSSGGLWIFPKGHIDSGRSHIDQAALEAYEEAGIVGTVLDPPIGTFQYAKNSRDYEVEVYLMFVRETLDRWPERANRRRVWVSLDRAAEMHSREDAQEVFELGLRHIRSWHRLRSPRSQMSQYAS